MKKSFKLSASLISGDLSNLNKEIDLLVEGGIDYLHFDVMDGIFVPRFGLYPEMLSMVRAKTSLPINVHLMIENVEPYIDIFAANGASYITFHAESTQHVHRMIHLIHEKNIKAGIALNPGTSLEVLNYILDDIDLVMIMAINPGIPRHPLIKGTYEKIRDVKKKVKNYENILIEIDGGVSDESASQMVKEGADILVCGSQSIFKTRDDISQNVKDFKDKVTRSLQYV